MWKEASVHPDHYIQINKKAYSVPHPYVGKKVWVKVTHNIVQIYFNDKLIKQHIIPRGYRQTDFNDFPDNVRHALDKGIPAHLCKIAARVGINFGKLVRSILEPHAFINLRKAQGIVSLAQKHPSDILENAAQVALDTYTSVTPKLFKSIIEKIEQKEMEKNKQLSLSDEMASFVRDMEYFFNNK